LNVVALDLGSDFGYARYDGQTVFSAGHSMSKLPLEKRLLEFWNFINALHEFKKIDLIVFEYVEFHKSHYSSRAYWSFWCCVQLFCLRNTVEQKCVRPAALKQWATGKGNAGKDQMKSALKTRLGYDLSNDDEVDALWILHYFCQDQVETFVRTQQLKKI
jgi:Holliday junction resolvasome RuvABC endonuclease subunit